MSDVPAVDPKARYTPWQRVEAHFPERWSLGGHTLTAAYMGSTTHGTKLPSGDPKDVDDLDIMAIVVPPQRAVLGLERWQHWVWQQDELDVVAYAVDKWVRLLLKSNPNVVGLLWLDESGYLRDTKIFEVWRANRHRFLSLRIYESFCGYARSQLHGLGGPTGRAYQGAQRKELVKQYGYDLKHAAHCVRLLRMGTEALATGQLNVDRTGIDAEELMAIKRGEWSLERLKVETDRWQNRMEQAYYGSTLRLEPDSELAEALLIDTYDVFWARP